MYQCHLQSGVQQIFRQEYQVSAWQRLTSARDVAVKSDKHLILARPGAFRYIERDRLHGGEISNRLVHHHVDRNLHGVCRDSFALGVRNENVDGQHHWSCRPAGTKQHTPRKAVFDGYPARLDRALPGRLGDFTTMPDR